MNNTLNVPWEKIYQIVLSCGNVHDLKTFSIKVLSELEQLCNIDQSLIYFLNGNGKVCNQYLKNIDKQWSNLYLEYYSKVDNGRYSLEKKDLRENSTHPIINIRVWENEDSNEFISEYINSRGVKYSLGFALFDLYGMPRTIFALDKKRNKNFTHDEFKTISMIIPLLNNLHKSFFYQETSRINTYNVSWGTEDLTSREKEIVDLLCKGISPTNISKLLYITQATTNKHISNIYKKLNVSNIQELLVHLLT